MPQRDTPRPRYGNGHLPIAGDIRGFSVPIRVGQSRAMRESARSAGGAVTECDPVVRGGDGL